MKKTYFILFLVVVGVWVLVANINKRMMADCVAGGHSVDYCEFQVYYK